jgi:CheY-like chemotaxis protein
MPTTCSGLWILIAFSPWLSRAGFRNFVAGLFIPARDAIMSSCQLGDRSILPLLWGPEEEPDMFPEPPALLPSPAPTLSATQPRKVLVVEDNTDAALSLEVLLTLWGHQVKVVFNGIDALVAAQQWKPNVVLCDIGLPGLNGFDVARALRSSGIRMIAITGYGSAGFQRTALACGYKAVLVKPADPHELARLLHN